MNLWRRFTAFFRKGRLEDEMSEELRLHLEQRTREHLAGGLSPEEATYAARRQFGGMEQVKELAREQRLGRWFEEMCRDFQYAARALRKSPGFTTAVVFAFALGIGLVALQLSFISGALFHGLPFERSERLMRLSVVGQHGSAPTDSLLEEFYRWREQQKSFSNLAAHVAQPIEISGSGLQARGYEGAAFSAGLLELLRVQPILGRGFLPGDEAPDASVVVLLSQRVWRDQFASDPNVIGRSIRMRGEPALVIGVMPDGFAFPNRQMAWVNLGRSPAGATRENGRGPRVIGRLRDDTTLAAARTEFDVIVKQSLLNGSQDRPVARRAEIVPLALGGASSELAVLLYSLLGMVGGVLALACVNVANLLSARALQRGHDLACMSLDPIWSFHG